MMRGLVEKEVCRKYASGWDEVQGALRAASGADRKDRVRLLFDCLDHGHVTINEFVQELTDTELLRALLSQTCQQNR